LVLLLLPETQKMMKCEAPGCTSIKRGPIYCDKHRQQIKKHGKLRPDLERLPHKNLRKQIKLIPLVDRVN